MNNKKNLLLTFDYELFLGKRSGTVEKCMIEPTKNLLSVLNCYKVKSIFFIDTTYLIRLSELDFEKAKNDYEKIRLQIREIVKSGHYVFPHLHPHWIDAKYIEIDNQWDLSNFKKYRFHTISTSERDDLFERSMNILAPLVKEIDNNYTIDGFRAGGWCIQPFADFYPYFIKHGIKYDFSVLKGLTNFTNAQHYDFTNAPSKSIYSFANDVIKEEDGNFYEISISTIRHSEYVHYTSKIVSKFLWKMGIRSSGKGYAVDVAQPGNNNTSKKKNSELEMVSIELLNCAKLNSYLKYFRTNNFMHFISHPKMISTHNLTIFNRFLKKIVEAGDIETDFKNMLFE